MKVESLQMAIGRDVRGAEVDPFQRRVRIDARVPRMAWRHDVPRVEDTPQVRIGGERSTEDIGHVGRMSAV